MKILLFGLFISIISFACSNDREEAINFAEYIPENNSLYIIDTPDIENFLRQADTVEFFCNYGSLLTPEIGEQIRTLINYSKHKASIISINKTGKGHLNYILIAKDTPGEILIDSIKNISLETLTYKNYTIQKYGIENITIFKAEKNGVFIAGSSRQQIEQILEKDQKGLAADELFTKVHAAIDHEKTSIILRDEALAGILSANFEDTFIPQWNLARWSVIDIAPGINSISLNGIATWDAREDQFLRVFRNAGNHINEIANITPVNARGFFSFTYENISELLRNLERFTKTSVSLPANHLLSYTSEAGMITLNNGNKLPVFKTSDPELANDLLFPVEETDGFRGIGMFVVPEDLNLLSYLTPLIPNAQSAYYIWLENFIIFAEDRADLEQVVSSHLNNSTLGRQEYYNNAMENLAAASSLLIVSNNPERKSISPDGSQSEQDEKAYPIITMQFVVEKDFAHIHGAFGAPVDHKTTSVGQIATINLEAPLGTLPFMVKNHVNGQPEVMVQDENNVLYLFSSSGSLLWKKQFAHQIMGEIEQVNISNNLLYAFSTPYAIHVIDRKGNPVKPFPLEFKDEITQPLAIFDYDNNRTYRFVLTQGNNILMYDAKGKLVRGFDFDKLNSPIIQPPKHIRLTNKDYILVPESSGKLNILSRQGKSRIEVTEDIEFSAAEWFPYKNNFISISAKGGLITVNEKGNISTEAAGENGNVSLAAKDNLLVTMADNTFKINDKVVNLDYGLYTSPNIFTTGQKTFISITDTQAQRVYIFDANANLLPGFPLYGNSQIRTFTNGNNINFFSVQGDEDEIILYQF